MSRTWNEEELKRASEQMKKQGQLGYEEFIKEWERKTNEQSK